MPKISFCAGEFLVYRLRDVGRSIRVSMNDRKARWLGRMNG